MLQPTDLPDGRTAHPAPAFTTPDPTHPEPPADLLAALITVRGAVRWPATGPLEATLSPSGTSLAVPVASFAELAAWYDAYPTATVGAGSRAEMRDGQMFGLGGLDWHLSIRGAIPGVQVWLTAVTLEDEFLTESRLARVFPELARRVAPFLAAVQGVAA